MKTLLLLLISISCFAQDIHFKSILIDTHNDCLTACIEKKVALDTDLTGINHSENVQLLGRLNSKEIINI